MGNDAHTENGAQKAENDFTYSEVQRKEHRRAAGVTKRLRPLSWWNESP